MFSKTLHSVINRKTQKGAALLAFIMIFIVASAYTLVKKLNSNTIENVRHAANFDVLNKAKAALIGYAVNYPLDHSGVGPGRLPCPDTNNNGSAVGNCTGATTGRLPYKTLELEDLRDQFGQRLWYRVANNYRSYTVNPPAVNSDTAGNFSVDGNADIVAVIFAPGSPVAAQDRAADELDVANYLEDDNADTGDAFVTSATLNPNNEFNDTLITITRQELMSAVEKRVLGDVAEALTNYQTASNAYPWLSAFADPSASTFRGAVNTWQGHLPFHWAADPDSVEQGGAVAGRNPFATNVAVSWNNITGATTNITSPLSGLGIFSTVSTACLNDINNCDEGGIFPVLTSLASSAAINCTWTNQDTADCDSFSVTTNNVAYTINPCAPGTISRTYTINFPTFTATSTINPPTTTTLRTRDVSLAAVNPVFIPAQTLAISITDTYVGNIGFFGFCFTGPFTLTIGTGTSTFNANSVEGTIAVNNIQYDLSIDDGELPTWFVENGWHELIYLTYASDEVLPGDTTAGQDCNSLGTCLSININGSTNTLVRAAALSAGATLTGQDRATAPNEADYFDDTENTDLDNVFLKNRTTTTYNDQTRIISTAP